MYTIQSLSEKKIVMQVTIYFFKFSNDYIFKKKKKLKRQVNFL